MKQILVGNVLVMPLLYALSAYLGAVQLGTTENFARISAAMTFVTTMISTLTPGTKPPAGSTTVTTTPETVTIETEASSETIQKELR